MHIYKIQGGNRLSGELNIQGSKNAVIPLLAAALLNKEITILDNCPQISDVYQMTDILAHLGCKVYQEKNTLIIDASEVNVNVIPGHYAKSVRGSILFMGALLARCGYVVMDFPGGCHIGKRPVDYHIDAFRKMGADISVEENRITCKSRGLKGCIIELSFPSVGATENVILAGACAEGTTIIKNAAKEPEITELCRMLSNMGVIIHGAGTEEIAVTGKVHHKEIRYDVMSDRIVAGTYICAAAATGGDICCIVNRNDTMTGLVDICRDMGFCMDLGNDYVRVKADGRIKSVPYVKTEPYPGFPTDMQSQLMSVLSVADGNSIIEESIFENRFHIVDELLKMGADIYTEDGIAYIKGVDKLSGAELYAKDLRGGAALILAGLLADGMTVVSDPGYISRGYENITENITMLGGNIHLA